MGSYEGNNCYKVHTPGGHLTCAVPLHPSSGFCCQRASQNIQNEDVMKS